MPILFGSLAFLAGCLTTRHIPPYAAFITPPYTELVIGLKPISGESSITWPRMAPGDVVAFYSYGPTDRMDSAVCGQPACLQVIQPGGEVAVAVSDNFKAISTRNDVSMMDLMAYKSGIQASNYVKIVHLEGASAQITTFEAQSDLTTKHDRKEMKKKVETQTMPETDSQTRIINIETGTTTAAQSRENIEKMSIAAALSQNMLTARSERNLKSRYRPGASNIQKAQQSAVFGSINDRHGIQVIDDSVLTAMLEDMNVLDGFYGENDLLLISDVFMIPADEGAALLSNLRESRSLLELINRPLSAAFRRQDKRLSGISHAAEMQLVCLNPGSIYHGQTVIFSMTVQNIGDSPLYDMVIFNKLPAHATFSRFPIPAGVKSGYMQFYLDDQKLLFWKIYRPLNPGETFKTSFALKLDSWNVDDYVAHNDISR